MYRQYKILKFYVLPTQCIYVFCVDLRTNSDYFPIEYHLTDIYNKNLNFYTSVVTICTTSLTLSYSTICQLSVFLCFVWICVQQRLFHCTTLNDWFYKIGLSFYRTVVTMYTTMLTFIACTLCPHWIYRFRNHLRTNSDYSLVQH